ncbi:reverse transcriptase domain, reverse transcriptase zinc-binding domain protein [Tanacetum coccineum]
MGWTFKEENLDLVLVPSGILIMSIYHVFLINRYKSDLRKIELKNRNPRNSDSKKSNWITTSIGYENHNKKAWAANILEMEVKDRGLAVTVLNGQISAATTTTTFTTFPSNKSVESRATCRWG